MVFPLPAGAHTSITVPGEVADSRSTRTGRETNATD